MYKLNSKLFPKKDKVYIKMKTLNDKYWNLEFFDRSNADINFVENEKELIKIGKEIFNTFNIQNINYFLDICAAPGIYSTIILKKFNNSTGLGISLPIDQGGVPFKINNKRYQIIYKNILNLTNFKIKNKIDFGIASCVSYKYNVQAAYFLNLQLIVQSLILLLQNLNTNGHIIINLTMKNINFAFNIIHLLNTMFKNFKLWKSQTIWTTKKTFYYFGYYFKNNFNLKIFEDLKKRIENNKDIINYQFIGSLDSYNKINKQMQNIYNIRIKAWKQLILQSQQP